MRNVLIFLVAGIPLAAFLDDTSKLTALLALLFFFNLLRGISSAAWMPWIAQLISEEVRGALPLGRSVLHVFRVFAFPVDLCIGHRRPDFSRRLRSRFFDQRARRGRQLGFHQANS